MGAQRRFATGVVSHAIRRLLAWRASYRNDLASRDGRDTQGTANDGSKPVTTYKDLVWSESSRRAWRMERKGVVAEEERS